MEGKEKMEEVQKKEYVVKGSEILPAEANMPSNPNLQTLFADIVSIITRNDGFSILRFYSRAPGLNIEQCRVALPQQITKALVDVLCQTLAYYPSPIKKE
jgi:hypothetical protein